jgi:hypothetical protein
MRGRGNKHPSVDWATAPGCVDGVELGNEEGESDHGGDDGPITVNIWAFIERDNTHAEPMANRHRRAAFFLADR